jgi:hypothetical protein
MGMVLISDEDKAQVRAILETHAEMQDRRSLENLELISRMNVQEADDKRRSTARSRPQGSEQDIRRRLRQPQPHRQDIQ